MNLFMWQRQILPIGIQYGDYFFFFSSYIFIIPSQPLPIVNEISINKSKDHTSIAARKSIRSICHMKRCSMFKWRLAIILLHIDWTHTVAFLHGYFPQNHSLIDYSASFPYFILHILEFFDPLSRLICVCFISN